MSGSCLCATVQFAIRGEFGPVRYCHCDGCKRSTGTAFSANARVRAQDFEITAGREAISEYESSPGVFRGFCSNCGSPMYARVESEPEHIRIRLGTLDEDPGVQPVAHVWVADTAVWFEITDDLPRHPAAALPDGPG